GVEFALEPDDPAEDRGGQQAEDNDRQRGRCDLGREFEPRGNQEIHASPLWRPSQRGPARRVPGRAAMTEWLLSLEGTAAALQMGRHDPCLPRPPIAAAHATIAAPFALLVVPWPGPHLWPILAGAIVCHTAYRVAQAMSYSRGAYGVVYPVVRGTGPFFAVI